MKLKNVFYCLAVWISVILLLGACKKASTTPKSNNSGNFWYGNIIGTNNFLGPGNAILLRTDGTMRQYANDYYSAATTMGPSDTATAKIKVDGTYSKPTSSTITATWYYSAGAITYTINGTISGTAMTGNIGGVAIGGTTSANFKYSNAVK